MIGTIILAAFIMTTVSGVDREGEMCVSLPYTITMLSHVPYLHTSQQDLWCLHHLQVVHAQPQYRVLVVPPADIQFTFPGVTITNVNICVREFDNDDTNTDYCPLGMTSLPADGPSGPPEILQFGDGHESLQGPIPSITFGTTTVRGIGLALSLFGDDGSGTSGVLGDPLIDHRFLINPGQTESTGLVSISGLGEFRVSLRVECLSGYKGIDCNTPVPTTTETTTTTTNHYHYH